MAEVSKALYRLGLNLEDSSMTRLKGEFTIMLVVSSQKDIEAEDITEALKEAQKLYGLYVVCREIEENPFPSQAQPLYRIVVFGSDRPGIVYGVASVLASLGLNICDLRTEKRGSIYVMILEAEGEEHVEDRLRQELSRLRDTLGVDISLERLEEERL